MCVHVAGIRASFTLYYITLHYIILYYIILYYIILFIYYIVSYINILSCSVVCLVRTHACVFACPKKNRSNTLVKRNGQTNAAGAATLRLKSARSSAVDSCGQTKTPSGQINTSGQISAVKSTSKHTSFEIPAVKSTPAKAVKSAAESSRSRCGIAGRLGG